MARHGALQEKRIIKPILTPLLFCAPYHGQGLLQAQPVPIVRTSCGVPVESPQRLQRITGHANPGIEPWRDMGQPKACCGRAFNLACAFRRWCHHIT
ncbi:hypothetical protein WJX75_006769 [Coccomyxa subellipsoidea]|uniref:Secreted protein n=1 Tax=Coccomyxa subellipsoidea TaxID=248742 RepID=A0ABR2YAG1_9CHLO